MVDRILGGSQSCNSLSHQYKVWQAATLPLAINRMWREKCLLNAVDLFQSLEGAHVGAIMLFLGPVVSLIAFKLLLSSCE